MEIDEDDVASREQPHPVGKAPPKPATSSSAAAVTKGALKKAPLAKPAVRPAPPTLSDDEEDEKARDGEEAEAAGVPAPLPKKPAARPIAKKPVVGSDDEDPEPIKPKKAASKKVLESDDESSRSEANAAAPSSPKKSTPPAKAVGRATLKGAKATASPSKAPAPEKSAPMKRPPSKATSSSKPAAEALSAANQRVVNVAYSGLDEAERDLLLGFPTPQVAKKTKASLSLVVSDEVVPGRTTHLIIGSKAVRSLKVLSALAAGIWVVSFEWISKSLEADKWVPCSPYETIKFPGAKKSRVARKGVSSQDTLLLAGKTLLLSGRMDPPREKLSEMVKHLGGTLTTVLASADYVVATPEGASIAKGAKCPVLSVEWLLDAISQYQLPDTQLPKYDALVKKAAPSPSKAKAKVTAPKKTPAKKPAAKKKVLDDSDEGDSYGSD